MFATLFQTFAPSDQTAENQETPLTGAILLFIMLAIVALNVQLILTHNHAGMHRPVPVVAAAMVAKSASHMGAH